MYRKSFIITKDNKYSVGYTHNNMTIDNIVQYILNNKKYNIYSKIGVDFDRHIVKNKFDKTLFTIQILFDNSVVNKKELNVLFNDKTNLSILNSNITEDEVKSINNLFNKYMFNLIGNSINVLENVDDYVHNILFSKIDKM